MGDPSMSDPIGRLMLIGINVVDVAIERAAARATVLEDLDEAFARLPHALRRQASSVVQRCLDPAENGGDVLLAAWNVMDDHLAEAAKGDERAIEAMLGAGVTPDHVRAAIKAYAAAVEGWAAAEHHNPAAAMRVAANGKGTE